MMPSPLIFIFKKINQLDRHADKGFCFIYLRSLLNIFFTSGLFKD